MQNIHNMALVTLDECLIVNDLRGLCKKKQQNALLNKINYYCNKALFITTYTHTHMHMSGIVYKNV